MRAWILGSGLLMAALAVPASAASSAKAKPSLDPEKLKLVELFLKTPAQNLPPESVPYFLEIDSEALPAKLKPRYQAKRFELLTLMRLSEGERKGSVRRPGQAPEENCGDPDVLSDMALKLLLDLGFVEKKAAEVAFLMKETKCTECEMRTEFTLTVIQLEPKPGRKKPPVRFFFHGKDPILALLVNYGRADKYGNTAFFGVGGGPKCRY